MCDRTQSLYSGHSMIDIGDIVGEGLYCGHYFVDNIFRAPLTTSVMKLPQDKK